MFVVDVIERAVLGELRFEFIDSTITALHGNAMSSQKGSAISDSTTDGFRFEFMPRTPLPPEWSGSGGFLDGGNHRFQVSGRERNSADWIGASDELKAVVVNGKSAVRGRVSEWTRTDDKAVHSSFVRVVVPGQALYPAKVRNLPGRNDRAAFVTTADGRIEFHDHVNYTEILVLNARSPQTSLADDVVGALARVVGQPLGWVYRELHENRQRIITVRGAIKESVVANKAAVYAEFWAAYLRALEEIQQPNFAAESAS